MSGAQQLPKSMTLIDVKKQFQLWRDTKNFGARIPESLWELVAKLLATDTDNRAKIGVTLGISTKQMRARFPEQFQSKVDAKKTFVRAPLLTTMEQISGQITILRTNGTKLIFSAVSQEQFTQLVAAFVG